MSRDELRRKLEDHGVDVTMWGIGSAKSLDDLLDELEEGDCTLKFPGGQACRYVSVATVAVTDHTGRLTLVEYAQLFNDGRIRNRYLEGVSEKVKANEHPREGAVRGLEEELGLTNVGVDDIAAEWPPCEFEEKDSVSYPGLKARYSKYLFKLRLRPSEEKTVYVEDDGKKKTVFIWVGAPELKNSMDISRYFDRQQEQNTILQNLGVMPRIILPEGMSYDESIEWLHKQRDKERKAE